MLKNVGGFLVFTIMINAVLFSYFDLTDSDVDRVSDRVSDRVRETIITLPELESIENMQWSKNDQEVICMAQNIFHEARNQSVDGMMAVAFVTLNRVDHVNYPASVCDVVYEPFQFSWTVDMPEINKADTIELRAWEQSLDIAVDSINGEVYNSLYGVTHYHSVAVDPFWNNGKVLAAQIDDHIFYRSY